jgi:leader peptidase (prepilin peptidase)/N-methyltransferase
VGIGSFFGLMTLFFPLTPALFFVLIVTCLLICCFFTDFDYFVLPDQLTIPLVWVGLLGSLFPIFISPHEAIIGAFSGYGIFWLMNEIYRYFRQKDGMFPGDFKLNAGVGACIGIKLLLPVLAIALLLLISTTFMQLMKAKNPSVIGFLKKEVAYGCYLSIVAIGTIFLMFFGVFH